MKLKKTFLSLGILATVVFPLTGIISCGSVTKSVTPKPVISNPVVQKPSVAKAIEEAKDIRGISPISSPFGKDYILDRQTYNNLYHKLDDSTVGIAVIANHKVYEDVVESYKDETIMELLDDSRFHFKRFGNISMGAFLNTFALRSNPETYIHGTRIEKNYGDYYPMYYINHKFAQLGVSNFHLQGHEMLEFSFDNK